MNSLGLHVQLECYVMSVNLKSVILQVQMCYGYKNIELYVIESLQF